MSASLEGHWTTASAPAAGGASRLDVLGERAVAVGVGLLIVAGFASSYTTLHDLAVEVGGFPPWLAPVVPLSFDLGIVVLSLKIVLAARAGSDSRVLRVLVLLLSAATVVANGASATSAVGSLLHAVPPAMFVVCFETLAASARHSAHLRRPVVQPEITQTVRIEPVLTAARWLLAPRQTWAIWRARILGSSTSLAETPLAVDPGAPLPPGRRSAADASHGGGVPMEAGESAVGSTREHSASLNDLVRLRPPGPVGRTVAMGQSNSAGAHHGRLAAAEEALRADPAMTAVSLAAHLVDAGHPVSVRTAQRIRRQAQQRLGVGADGIDRTSAPARERPAG